MLRAGIVATLAIFLIIIFALAASAWVIDQSARGRIIADPARLPANEIALVMGTTPSARGGFANPHFDNRMKAAAELFRLGRVKRLLLSGDNGSRGYDEPGDMRKALRALGVPDSAITLDNAGYRTLDSVVRASRIFGQQRFIIVTDGFHAARSIFLARHFGLDAVAFPSREVALRDSLRSRVREVFAQVKALLDVYVLRTQPHLLGPQQPLRSASAFSRRCSTSSGWA